MAANIPQDPDGPSVQACELIAQADSVEAKVINTYDTIKSAITKAIQLLLSILYGTVNLIDVLGSEMATAIPIAASAIANSILTGASKAVSTLFEAILSQILTILLSFPNAIFSLVAIPLEKAIESGQNEQRYLNKAKTSLQAANIIMSKWATNINGAEYYKKMKLAFPIIVNILKLIQQMLSDLGSVSQNIDTTNAVFDQIKYDNLKSQLRQAISIIQPATSIDNTVQFTKAITDELNNQKKDKIAVIDLKYSNRRKQLDIDFTKKLSQINVKGNSIKEHLIISAINLTWSNAVKQLQMDQKIEIDLVNSDINYQQLTKVIVAKEVDLYYTFISDMNLVANYLSAFLDDIKDAYIQNLQCQAYCVTIYNARKLIQNLVKEIIALLRKTGNASAIVAEDALESAEALVSTTKDLFQTNLDEYEGQFSGKSQSSPAVLSVALTTGNILLETTDATLSGLITDSLIKLINADDVLQAGKNDFDNFIKNLKKIPDWSPSTGSWIENLTGGISVNPYIQLIADATQMLVVMPVLSFSKESEAKTQLLRIEQVINKSFNTIIVHNGFVMGVLNSYVPYQSPECGNLKRMLNQLGMLDSFALGLSIAAITGEFLKMTPNLNPNSLIPSEENCRHFYPDLFDDPDAVAASFSKTNNVLQPVCHFNTIQKVIELKNPFMVLAARSRGMPKNSIDDLQHGPTESAYGGKNPYSGFTPMTKS
jgi:hypothetical protein